MISFTLLSLALSSNDSPCRQKPKTTENTCDHNAGQTTLLIDTADRIVTLLSLLHPRYYNNTMLPLFVKASAAAGFFHLIIIFNLVEKKRHAVVAADHHHHVTSPRRNIAFARRTDSAH